MIIFPIFAQNIDCGLPLEPPSTHNLCFRAKKENKVYPCNYTDMLANELNPG